jgi:hypothetical protein
LRHGASRSRTSYANPTKFVCVLVLTCATFATSCVEEQGVEPSIEETLRVGECDSVQVRLWTGVSRQTYWPSGFEGKIGQAMSSGALKCRELMYKNDIDWCGMTMRVPDGWAVVIGPESRAAVAVGDDVLRSVEFLVSDDKSKDAELQAWSSKTDWLRFSNDACPYRRSESSPGWFVMWVGFPRGTLLQDKAEGMLRPLRIQPTEMWLENVAAASLK